MTLVLIFVLVMSCAYHTGAQLQLTGTEEVQDKIGKFQLKCTFQRTLSYDFNITEIRIIKDEEVQVSVKEKSKLKAYNNRLSFQIAGSINNVAGKGSLDISFYYPNADDVNIFSCSADAVNKDGVLTILNTTEFNVSVVHPAPTELFNFYSKLLLDLPQSMHKMNNLIQQLSQNVYSLNQKAKNSIKEKEKDKKQALALVNRVNILQKKLTPHLETGQVICGDTEGGFPKKGQHGFQISETEVSFKKPFFTTPIVVFSVRQVDVGSVKSVKYMAQPVDISKEGFTMRCGVWGDGVVNKNIISWTAFNNN